MSNLQWRDVGVNFNDSNNIFSQGIAGLSRAGDVFGKINDFMIKQDELAQRRKEHQLEMDYKNAMLHENIRSALADEEYKRLNLSQSDRHFNREQTERERAARESERLNNLNYLLNRDKLTADVAFNQGKLAIDQQEATLKAREFDQKVAESIRAIQNAQNLQDIAGNIQTDRVGAEKGIVDAYDKLRGLSQENYWDESVRQNKEMREYYDNLKKEYDDYLANKDITEKELPALRTINTLNPLQAIYDTNNIKYQPQGFVGPSKELYYKDRLDSLGIQLENSDQFINSPEFINQQTIENEKREAERLEAARQLADATSMYKRTSVAEYLPYEIMRRAKEGGLSLDSEYVKNFAQDIPKYAQQSALRAAINEGNLAVAEKRKKETSGKSSSTSGGTGTSPESLVGSKLGTQNPNLMANIASVIRETPSNKLMNDVNSLIEELLKENYSYNDISFFIPSYIRKRSLIGGHYIDADGIRKQLDTIRLMQSLKQ